MALGIISVGIGIAVAQQSAAHPVSPLPLDFAFLDLIPAEKLREVFIVTDQHQFLKFAAGVFEARDLFAGANTGSNDRDLSAFIIRDLCQPFSSAEHLDRPLS